MYFGHKTPFSFACWVLFAVCFIQGCIWLPISGVSLGGCKYCRDRFKDTGKTNLSLVAWNLTYAYGLETGCIVSAFEFDVYYPQEAAGANAPNDYYNWCINSGPIAGLIGGGVAMVVALLTLPLFFCASPPHPSKHHVSFIGPTDLSPDAYAEATNAAYVAQQQQQLKYANAAAAGSYGSQMGLLAAAGASPYTSAASSPLGARTVASPQLLLSPRVTLSPAGSMHSPPAPGAGAGYVIYTNPAAAYPVNSAGPYAPPGPAVLPYGTVATQPPGLGGGGVAEQQQLGHPQQPQQPQPQDTLEQMQAQQRQQQQALMQQRAAAMQLSPGGQPMAPHPHLGGRAG
ncbi:hypothetical protein HXX76_005528 [Chlamydomonas incerta]|uniref:Uncharacterized protein n=1 Tax=Chlamydomonas incerta TaxID=51695 RepID=A0A835T6J4_CHLIN|nr:hypothetical protein HXX76_005528 [Chlamydomonas incerta]|eukprot:KAG2437912.1 hypothetical protein HXX76_005528 [Chlamydomonas incerta]